MENTREIQAKVRQQSKNIRIYTLCIGAFFAGVWMITVDTTIYNALFFVGVMFLCISAVHSFFHNTIEQRQIQHLEKGDNRAIGENIEKIGDVYTFSTWVFIIAMLIIAGVVFLFV